ncbi:MAG: hypothetical protein V4649_07050 [Bacteroidota bacterium]
MDTAKAKPVVKATVLLLVIAIFFSSCSSWWHPRWASSSKGPNAKKDHYDPYKRKWYKKRWRDGTLWK